MSYQSYRAALIVATIFAAGIAATSTAQAASERVRTACTSDYLQYCSQYDPDSFQTVDCMKRNRKKLSQACRVAINEDGGPPKSRKVVSRQR